MCNLSAPARRPFAAVSALAAVLLALSPASLLAQAPYKLPPKEIVDILDAPPLPTAKVSPDRQALLLVEEPSMPPVAEVGQPMLRLAGYRINPNTNGSARTNGDVSGLLIKRLTEGAGAKDQRIQVPEGSTLGFPDWSPDGAHISFTRTTDSAVELWLADAATGAAKRLTDARLNATLGDPCIWMPDNAHLLCRFVPDDRGSPPVEPVVPPGPTIEQSLGHAAPVPTYEDLLKDAHDEALFDYYFTSQLALVDVATGARTPVGKPGIFDDVAPSPDGRYLLVTRTVRPYSYHVPEHDFAKQIEVWTPAGELVHTVASLPLAELPNRMVRTGPRSIDWRPQGATLVWQEAIDGGDPKRPAEFRDHVVELAAPFTGSPAELLKTAERVEAIVWAGNDLAIITGYDRDRAWTKTWIVDADHPGSAARVLPGSDRSSEDRYHDPGRPVLYTGVASGFGFFGFSRGGPRGNEAIRRGNVIYLAGDGASPQGERPFLDRLDLKTLKTRRLWQSDAAHYESVVALLDDAGNRILTQRESATEPPNYFLRRGGKETALTQFADPAPRFTNGVKKELVVYQRADGLPLNGMLYLPPDYQPGTRLPTILWAYPREFVSAAAAGQVTASTNRFTLPRGAGRMHLLLALEGYAVFDGPSMPILGGDTANNHYVEQLVADARAAIEKLTAMGVTDSARVGVGGHSYGAFMTANLMTHSTMFRAGTAESGAYNRTLTPFGFQNERRFYWQAPDLYNTMSPFQNATKLSGAILLTHGMKDDNSGTFPIQSERYYAALKGLGKTVRFVYLPFEAHGYLGRENVLDVFAEELAWFDHYVKNAGEPEGKPVGPGRGR
jgi:dipeptidyl aminopeptidase/acylaminoacyl peptidase